MFIIKPVMMCWDQVSDKKDCSNSKSLKVPNYFDIHGFLSSKVTDGMAGNSPPAAELWDVCWSLNTRLEDCPSAEYA